MTAEIFSLPRGTHAFLKIRSAVIDRRYNGSHFQRTRSCG
jgi:hypothetical protein